VNTINDSCLTFKLLSKHQLKEYQYFMAHLNTNKQQITFFINSKTNINEMFGDITIGSSINI